MHVVHGLSHHASFTFFWLPRKIFRQCWEPVLFVGPMQLLPNGGNDSIIGTLLHHDMSYMRALSSKNAAITTRVRGLLAITWASNCTLHSDHKSHLGRKVCGTPGYGPILVAVCSKGGDKLLGIHLMSAHETAGTGVKKAMNNAENFNVVEDFVGGWLSGKLYTIA